VDIEDENLIYLRTEWQTKRNLDAHLRSPLFSVLLGAMKLLDKEPEINIVATATRQVRWK
jgi:quinol monooxygenase YgiN